MASCTVASSHVVGTRESAARPVSVRPARRVFAAIHLFGRSAFCSGGSLLFGRSASCRNPGAATCQGARCAGVQTSASGGGGSTARTAQTKLGTCANMLADLRRIRTIKSHLCGHMKDTCSMLVLPRDFFSDTAQHLPFGLYSKLKQV